MIPVTAAILAWLFIKVFRMPERFIFLYRKPFNCLMCLSFWFAVILLFVPDYIITPLFSVSLAAALGAWLEK
jgi:hypothetical protein